MWSYKTTLQFFQDYSGAISAIALIAIALTGGVWRLFIFMLSRKESNKFQSLESENKSLRESKAGFEELNSKQLLELEELKRQLDSIVPEEKQIQDLPFEFVSCFISYSHKDDEFTRRLHADLQDSGVRCCFTPEDLKIGDSIRSRIDDSIRVHDKLLLIVSENSIESDWVEYEAERALERERKRGGTVLFPVRLDDSIMKAGGTWADHIRDCHIGDFRN
jgi:hypothetical protein